MFKSKSKDSIQISKKMGNFNYTEEKIPIQAYTSSEALKNEIGKRIINRRKTNWDIVQIFSEGPFIYLKFKLRIENHC